MLTACGGTGPAGGVGWFIHLFGGAPREINVTNIQLPANATHLVRLLLQPRDYLEMATRSAAHTLTAPLCLMALAHAQPRCAEPLPHAVRLLRRQVIALQYPPNTSFVVESRGAAWCKDKYRTWLAVPTLGSTCVWAHRAVSSVAQVAAGRGDEYHYDGTHLYIRALPTSTYFDQSNGQTFRWDPDVVRSPTELAYPYTYSRSGVSLITPACGEPTALCGSHVRIKAACTPAFAGSVYCQQTAPVAVPAACPAAMTLAAGPSFDQCVPAPAPTAPPTRLPPSASPGCSMG